jgi:hypothetical protein
MALVSLPARNNLNDDQDYIYRKNARNAADYRTDRGSLGMYRPFVRMPSKKTLELLELNVS